MGMMLGLSVGLSGGSAGGTTNAAPVIDLNGASGGINATGTFTEGDGATTFLTSATVTDADDTDLASITIVGTNGFGEDVANDIVLWGAVDFPSNANKTANVVAGATTIEVAFVTATKTFTCTKFGGGVIPVADAQTFIRAFAYNNTATPPDTSDRVFTFVCNDGTDNSTAAVLTVTVAAAPTNSLDLGGDSGNYAGQFIIGGTAAAVSSSSAITGDDPTTMTITLGGFVDGNDETVTIGATAYPAATNDTGSATAGATTFDVTFTSGVFTVTKNGGGAMPKADLQTLIDGITTENAAWPFTTGARTLAFQCDGGTVKTATITNYIAELPREYVDTTYSLPTGGTTWTPADAAEFQTALTNSARGDVIVLEAGTTYTGNFSIPEKTGTGWVYVISDALASLPAGTLVTPADVEHMPRLVSNNASIPVLATVNNASHWRFAGIGIFTALANLDLVRTGYDESLVGVTDDADLPTHITFDRCYLASLSFANRLRHGIMLNGHHMAVIDTWIENIKDTTDAQAIWTFFGTGPYKVQNCFLEGTGENYLTGGTDPFIADSHPADIEFKKNYLFKRPTWRADNDWGVKNIFELKNSDRVEAVGNILEHNWYDAQAGYAVLFTPRNQTGTDATQGVHDVTFRDNVIRRTASGIVVTGSDGNFTSEQLERVHIKNIVLEDVTRYGFVNTRFLLVNAGEEGKPVKWLQLEDNVFVFDVEDTVGYAAIWFEPGAVSNVCDYFALVNSFMEMGTYGIITMTSYATNTAIDGNVLIYDADSSQYGPQLSGHAAAYPNSDKADEIADVEFVDLPGRDYALEPTSPWFGAGIGPDFTALNTALPSPIVVVQLDNLAIGVDVLHEVDIEAGAIAGPITLFPRIMLIHSHGPGITSLEMTFAGLLDGANEIVTIGGVSFPLNADKTDTTATSGDTTYSIVFVTSTGVFTITNNAGGEMDKEDLEALMVGITYDNTETTVTEGERTLAVNITGSAVTSTDATATIALTPLVLPTIKINFRNTSGYVTDGAGETYCIAGDTYPVTRGGFTFGWSSSGAVQTRDRNASFDRRLAGEHFIASSTVHILIDILPGTYDVTLAAGYGAGGGAFGVDIRDESGNSLLIADATGITSGNVIDAVETSHTVANWPANNVTAQIVVPTTSPQRIRIYRPAGATNLMLNHIALTPSA